MKKKLLFYLIIITTMVSCYPEGPEYYSDLDIVYTTYEDQFDFASKGTYSMPDKIVKITSETIEGDPEFVQEPYNSQILARIASNMTNLGWTKVDDPANADLTLFPASWTNTTIYYWYDYWCWYYYYYCGWGWGWGYYPTVSSYTTGTMLMTLVAEGDNYIEPFGVWTSALNGLLSGAYSTSRVNEGIDQAFEQSPYLNVK